MDPKEITSITGALNLIQSWFNKKEYEKVIQGSQEVLDLDPKNPRALAFYHRAQDLLWQEQNRLPHVEPPSSPPRPPQPPSPPITQNLTPQAMQENRRHFLTIFISALSVLLVGFGLLYWAKLKGDSKVPAPNVEEITAPVNPAYLEENSQRIEDLNTILNFLAAYEQKEGHYPLNEELLEAMKADSRFEDGLPLDPKHGDIDRRGVMYGYMYQAILDEEGVARLYNLSALFEDSQGLSYPWSHGVPQNNVSKFRDLKSSSLLIE